MDPLVEIIGGALAPKSLWKTWKKVFAPKANAVPRFYGPNTTLKFDLGHITSPLVYVVEGTLSDAPDASLIETGLPVSKGRTAHVDELPYWPSYRGASPQQRSVYIDWLLRGRQDPNVPIGYAFIYFYGLERRVIAENADHAAVAAETLRLLGIYSKSRSFLRYATRLLWTTIWLGLIAGTVSHGDLKSAIRQTTEWSEEIRGLSLACFYLLKLRLSANMAYLLTHHDPQAPRSVVVRREAELHKRSFCKRFDARFPHGFGLQVANQDRELRYFAASATLGRGAQNAGALEGAKIPDVLGVTSQFHPLIEIWSEAIDELRRYDRLHSKAADGEQTAEMYEALPQELRRGDHPHFDAWYDVLNRSATEDGWTVAPVAQLARVEGWPERKKLTKSQSTQLATTAAFMGLGLEPDARLTGRAYAWDEHVSVFPIADEMPEQAATYQSASLLLELGVEIAAADGVIDEVELRRIQLHLESQFSLSQRDSVRLEQLRYLRTRFPSQRFDAARSLRTKLTMSQRRLVGEFLVGIAAADGHVAPSETAALRRAYRALGLEANDLDSVLGTISTSPRAEQGPDLNVGELRLDVARINSLKLDTAKVAEFLKDVQADDSGIDSAPANDAKAITTATNATVPGTSANVSPLDPRFDGLSSRFVPFAGLAIGQEEWKRSALAAVARQSDLMLGAAIEAINEWAYDKLADSLLVENGDRVLVQRDLLQSKVQDP